MPRRSKKAAEDAADAPPPRRSTRTRKSVIDPDEVELEPARKRPRGKRTSATKVSYEEEENSNEPSKDSSKDDEFDPNDDVDDEEDKPKTPARGRGRGRRPAEHKDTPAPKPAGRGRGRKRLAPANEDVREHDDEQDDNTDKHSEKTREHLTEDSDSKTSKKQKFEDADEGAKSSEKRAAETKVTTAAASDTAVTMTSAAVAKTTAAVTEKKTGALDKTELEEQKPSSAGEKKEDEVAVLEKVREEKPTELGKASSTDTLKFEEKKPVAQLEKPTTEITPAKEDPTTTLAAAKEEMKPELPLAAAPIPVSELEVPKETTGSAPTTEPGSKEKTKENGLSGSTELKESTGYEPNAKADAPTEKDLSVASVVAPTASSGASGDVAKETREILEKADGAEVIAVQKATPAAAEAAESCGFKAVGSGATRLLLKPDSNVKLIGAVETGSLGALTHRELDGLSSQAYRANVEAYLATHCCATDEFMVATLSARGKSFTLVNVQMETKNPSVAALLVGCLMRQLDSRPHAFVVAGHMPHVQPGSPAYELLRDGYFGNSSIETLLRMQDIRMDAEDEWDKGLVDFLWKAYQHSRPWMRSVYETVLNSETPLSSTGRSMVWHSTKGVGVVAVLNHPKLARADLAIYIRD
ncbi:neurofilament medium polypeptide-like isoform X2 [Varroa jacobsoni]|uniref:Uncharacterized protein n=1 Tax=Varroa destructor TaxID=109461 RepID=A0A7M7MCJ3_VARDE|nr:neurofilament medium polypeptide-like [Varroa destructor]XP_022652110.1 neurofilament medium polypeptide-like [Varroa destructor]XP_022652111.1 neurofilament medium polypeptide-like [Varroa destructor]XP_022652112.1 neurofilament medium polypeptide-like [Varroa destructor]XP_022652113.1 neurofilament medium polypeptide-like [Varroa destructor]XP_022707219.1 neurofilament medium polypeptide-like isoform X2 [Varroa jacobsoni]